MTRWQEGIEDMALQVARSAKTQGDFIERWESLGTVVWHLANNTPDEKGDMRAASFCIDRLVNVYHEPPNTDYILAARRELKSR